MDKTEQLREALKNYVRTVMINGFPVTVVDLVKVERASYEELLRIAQENNIRVEDEGSALN